VTAKLIALIIPLGLDTLGAALALGVAGFPARRRTQLALWFAAFEAVMPLVGVVLGAPLGHAIGSAADYFAVALIAGLGIYMLLDDDERPERLLGFSQRGLLPAIALGGVSVSLDELAIGFSAGLLRLPIAAMVVAVAIQAFLFTQIGIRAGARAGAKASSAAEKIAGLALLALAAVLLIERVS
jgi:putative Mn2+ efflux pump MntP